VSTVITGISSEAVHYILRISDRTRPWRPTCPIDQGFLSDWRVSRPLNIPAFLGNPYNTMRTSKETEDPYDGWCVNEEQPTETVADFCSTVEDVLLPLSVAHG
jgi:hypothetical protein